MKFAERPRILTFVPGAVNSRRLLLVALAVLAAVGTPAAGARAKRTVGDLRVLVVLAGFPDRPLGRARPHFTGTPGSLVERLVAYYGEVSAGRLRIVPVVGRLVVTVPRARRTYVQRPADLARDALAAFAAAAVDPADRAALRDADALVVFFAGAGRESHVQGGDPDDPWSNYTVLAPPARADGVAPFDEACVIAEEEVPPFSNFGVLCHEFGHLLGLPELYAPGGLPHEGIGVWGLMGQGTWLGRGERPPHPEAWSKQRLGWVDVQTITRTTRGVALPAVTREPRVVRIPASPARPQEYYLLENRLRAGADERLPGEGVLVWHVDDAVTGFRSGQTKVEHKLLHLVEADGRGDLDRGQGRGGNRGDATDPWRGPSARRGRLGRALVVMGGVLLAAAAARGLRRRPRSALALACAAAAALWAASLLRRSPSCGPRTPGMAPYDGSPGRVVLHGISAPGPVVTLDVSIASPAAED